MCTRTARRPKTASPPLGFAVRPSVSVRVSDLRFKIRVYCSIVQNQDWRLCGYNTRNPTAAGALKSIWLANQSALR